MKLEEGEKERKTGGLGVYIYIYTYRFEGERVKGRSFGCTMGGPVRALSRAIPSSSSSSSSLIRLALILVTDKLRRIIQELALALARPPHPARPFRANRRPASTTPVCLFPSLPPLYPLPFFDRVNAFVIEEV